MISHLSGKSKNGSPIPRMVFIVSDSMASDLAFLPFLDKHREVVETVFVVPYFWFSSLALFQKSALMVKRAPWFYILYKFVDVYLYRVIRFFAGWDSLRRFQKRTAIPVKSIPNVNDAAFVDELSSLDPDLVVTMIPQIYGSEIVSRFAGRLINVHHAILPEYRGAFAGNFWTLVNGDTTSGTTVHLIETGIDSGPILTSATVSINDDDSVYSLHARCARLTLRCLDELIGLWSPGKPLPSTPQDAATATTYSFPTLIAYRTLRSRNRRTLRVRDILVAGVDRPPG